eukprot:COSAG02_NODE_1833_length_10721_cov_4.893523_7_plen_247_part_00
MFGVSWGEIDLQGVARELLPSVVGAEDKVGVHRRIGGVTSHYRACVQTGNATTNGRKLVSNASEETAAGQASMRVGVPYAAARCSSADGDHKAHHSSPTSCPPSSCSHALRATPRPPGTSFLPAYGVDFRCSHGAVRRSAGCDGVAIPSNRPSRTRDAAQMLRKRDLRKQRLVRACPPRSTLGQISVKPRPLLPLRSRQRWRCTWLGYSHWRHGWSVVSRCSSPPPAALLVGSGPSLPLQTHLPRH